MQQVLGFSALQGGFAWAASGITSMLFAGLSQALVTKGVREAGDGVRNDRHRRRDPLDHPSAGARAFPGRTCSGRSWWLSEWEPHSHSSRYQIAALAGVAEHEAGLASGLIYTSQELGGALGIAIASSIAASHYTTLLRGGDTVHAALTGGFHSALWVSGAIALLGDPSHLPRSSARTRWQQQSPRPPSGDPQPEPAT